MKNDYSTDPAAPTAGSSPPEAAAPSRGAGSTRSRIVWFFVALGCALLTARFGVWQLSRAHTKIAYANTVAARLDMPAVPQDALARDLATAEQQW